MTGRPVVLLLCCALAGCGSEEDAPAETAIPFIPPVNTTQPIALTDATLLLGIGPHQTQGVSLVDYTGDGWADVTLAAFDGLILLRGRGDGTFEHDNERAGIARDDVVKAMAPVFADVDADGDLDLFVTTMADSDRLFQNQGDGVFLEITEKAGLLRFTRSFGASFGDLDGDGDLDLLVAGGNHVSEAALPFPGLAANPFGADPCGTAAGSGDGVDDEEAPKTELPPGCTPGERGSPNIAWRNDGKGVFTDATAQMNLAGGDGDETFGGLIFDVDGDGDNDIVIARDHRRAQLFLNAGNGTFSNASETGIPTGTEGLMGMDVGDWDQDGSLDIYATNILTDVLLRQGAGGDTLYTDALMGALGDGIDRSLLTTGYGCALADLDHDGDVDVITTSAFEVIGPDHDELLRIGQMMVLENRGGGVQAGAALDITEDAFTFSPPPLHGGGLSVGDYDRDGDLDVLVGLQAEHGLWTHHATPQHRKVGLLLRNDGAGTSRPSVFIRLEAPGTINPFAVGARVDLETADSRGSRIVFAGSPYLSSHPFDLHFGLGEAGFAELLRIRWPNGQEQVVPCVPRGRHIIQPGQGGRCCPLDGPCSDKDDLACRAASGC